MSKPQKSQFTTLKNEANKLVVFLGLLIDFTTLIYQLERTYNFIYVFYHFPCNKPKFGFTTISVIGLAFFILYSKTVDYFFK